SQFSIFFKIDINLFIESIMRNVVMRSMEQKMHKVIIGLLGLSLTACLEAQPAPEISERPMSDFTIEVIAEGLKHPWAVAADDSGFFVTERAGKLYRISNNTKTEITGLPDDIYVEGQAGLFDVRTLDDKLYISYAYGNAGANGTALISAKVDDDSLTETKTLFRASPPKDTNAHFGGRIAFLPDQTLVLSTGEGFKYREAAQDLNSHLGKTIRLNMDGGIPENNPKLGDKRQVYSYGHRNPQGLTYDNETGQLWAHEHGPRGGDELNLILPGENYGWPIASKGLDYNGAKITPHETYEGMKDGVHVWTPSIAASGLAIYRGDMFPEWNGDALVGGLISRDLRLVDLENGKSVGEISLLSDLDARVRDVRVAKDGAILVLTDDSANGKLLRITPKK
ncbi:PQQ-dependent sugar dehydrogenase, partial [Hellea sp.]|nr:PQQ-dependent sugar dehydrogenase [Hellea sp.]